MLTIMDVLADRTLAGDYEIETEPIPPLNKRDVLIQTQYVRVCWQRKPWHPEFEPLEFTRILSICFHEVVGRVIEVGSEVSRLKIGDWVVPNLGREHLPRGAYNCFTIARSSEESQPKFVPAYFRDHERFLLKLPPSLRKEGVLVNSMANAHHCLQTLAKVHDESGGCAREDFSKILVVGLGGTGLSLAFLLRKENKQVFGIDPSPSAAGVQGELLKRVGGVFVAPNDLEKEASEGFDAIFLVSSQIKVLPQLFALSNSRGVVVIGKIPDLEPIPAITIPLEKQVFYVGAVSPATDDYEKAIPLLVEFSQQHPAVIARLLQATIDYKEATNLRLSETPFKYILSFGPLS